ncbi:MAG: hypothetical protein ACOY0T_35335 [Myxococcota bacterium]
MTLVLKCYLPGACTQFVLEPAEGVRLRLARDGELCPPGFNEDTVLELTFWQGQWFAQCLRGELCMADGMSIHGSFPVSARLILTLGWATLFFDDVVDPRIPACPLQWRQSMWEKHPLEETVAFDSAQLWQHSLAKTLNLQAPAAKLDLAPPPAIRPEELSRVQRPQESLPALVPIDEAPPEPAPPPPKPPQSKLKLVGYSVLAVAVVLSALGMWNPAAAETEAHAGTQPRTAAVPSPSAVTQAPPPALEPRSESANAKQAADYYATGDWMKARREYQALAATPEADPVFGVIARALEQRVARKKARP